MTSVTRVVVAAAAVATLIGATGGLTVILGAAVWGKPPQPQPCGCVK